MITIDGSVTAGAQLVLSTRNVAAPANGRRVRIVRISDGRVVHPTIVTWAADRVTASVGATPFGPFERPIPI
jgi:hypothetical protein